MKTKLLKQLRRKAHDSVRVVLGLSNDHIQVQYIDKDRGYWKDIGSAFYPREKLGHDYEAISKYVQSLRDKIFKRLADEKLYTRRNERLAKRFS